MNRRGFIGSILALGAAPAIVRADSLMRVVSRDATLVNVSGMGLSTAESGALIELLESRIQFANEDLIRQMTKALYYGGPGVLEGLRRLEA